MSRVILTPHRRFRRRGACWITALSAASGFPASVSGDLPPGYELVEIVSSDEIYDRPQMNNCGEIVYASGTLGAGAGDVYLYDNGLIRQIAATEALEGFPDINDDGAIVLTINSDGSGEQIMLLAGSEATILGPGAVPRINELGHVVWDYCHSTDCRYQCDVWFYDGKESMEIFNDGLSNQSPRMNNHDELVWTRYFFCFNPWLSDIFYKSGPDFTQLPTDLNQVQVPDVNDNGIIAWRGWRTLIERHVIELFVDGQLYVFTNDGINPYLNNRNDILFLRWYPPNAAWETWLYLADTQAFYRLTSEVAWNTDGDLNDLGECVWRWSSNVNFGSIFPKGVRFLRRIRDGDVNFDRYVSTADYSSFPFCMTGPGDVDRLCHCRFYDMQHDRDVDLKDFALFQNAMGNGQDCCADTHGPGCADHEIQTCVCNVLPDCCTTDWTSACVVMVQLLGCGECP